MTVRDVVAQLDSLHDELTIYATGGAEARPDSRAVAVAEPTDGSTPDEAQGLDYLLEVSEARQALDVWRNWRGGREPTLDEKCEAIIYYARHDAFLPT